MNGHARRARRTADQILVAAQSAFAAHGFTAATVDEIARRADVAPASVYGHFGGKAGIAQALADRALAVHDAYVAGAWSLDSTPLERLIAAGGATLRFSREEPVLFSTMSLAYLGAGAFGALETPAAASIDERSRLQIHRLTTTLEAAVEAGELRPLDAPAMAHFLAGSWAGVLSLAGRSAASADGAAFLAAGLRAIVTGAASPAALTRDGRLRSRYERAIERATMAESG